jgi:hypothetical protein
VTNKLIDLAAWLTCWAIALAALAVFSPVILFCGLMHCGYWLAGVPGPACYREE